MGGKSSKNKRQVRGELEEVDVGLSDGVRGLYIYIYIYIGVCMYVCICLTFNATLVFKAIHSIYLQDY